MSVAFWSEVITSKKPFETQPPEGYVMNLQNVAVANAAKSVSLFASTDAISGDKVNALLCVLGPSSPHAQLNLVFGYDVPVSFRVEGCKQAEVHISGYYQPVGDSDDDMDGDDDSEGDDFDEEAYLNTLKNADGTSSAEGKMVIKDDMSGESDDEESDSEDERVDADFIKKMVAQNRSGGDNNKKKQQEPESDSEEEDDDDEEEEEEEDESSEEEPPAKKVVSTPSGMKGGAGQSKPNTPASQAKPAGAGQSKPNTPANQGKSAQKQQQGSSHKHQQSGEKRKR